MPIDLPGASNPVVWHCTLHGKVCQRLATHTDIHSTAPCHSHWIDDRDTPVGRIQNVLVNRTTA